MPGWLCQEVLARHLYSPSMLCLISLQDWLSMDEKLRHPNPEAERINIPSNPRHYWRYRMHLTLEDLMQQNDFNNHVKLLVLRGGRG
jgi:4-alpha-glucanotransferase